MAIREFRVRRCIPWLKRRGIRASRSVRYPALRTVRPLLFSRYLQRSKNSTRVEQADRRLSSVPAEAALVEVDGDADEQPARLREVGADERQSDGDQSDAPRRQPAPRFGR